jgi:integrase
VQLRVVMEQAPGLHDGWVFPSETGGLRYPGALWRACLKASRIEQRFTIHGLRRTFNDLTRRAGVDAVVTKSLTGHVTEKMRELLHGRARREARGCIERASPRPSGKR